MIIVNNSIEIMGMKGILIQEQLTVFSFFNFLFLSINEHNKGIDNQILVHEKIHSQQYHSLDILLAEIVLIFQWFNPFAWFFRKSVISNLEFLADEGVLENGFNKKNYQELLVNSTFKVPVFELTNAFNNSIIKNRIKMMLSKKSSKLALCRYLVSIPVVGILMFVAGITFENSLYAQTKPEKEKKSSKDDEKVYTEVKTMPQFPGGEDAMIKFIASNVVYPEEARSAGFQGKVFTSFIIDKTGKVNDIKVLQTKIVYSSKEDSIKLSKTSFSPIGNTNPKNVQNANDYYKNLLEVSAIKAVSAMPNWSPGKNDKNEPVKVSFVLPVMYKLK